MTLASSHLSLACNLLVFICYILAFWSFAGYGTKAMYASQLSYVAI